MHYRLGAVGILVFIVASAGAASAGPVRSEFVEVAPDVRIHVLDSGPSAGPSIVLIPGWRLTASIWSEQIQRFSSERRVVAIDPRAQGDSTKTAEGDTPEQRAGDLHSIIDKLHLGRIVLVGWSQGVQDVAAYVNQFGVAEFEGIVLVDSTISPGAQQIVAEPQQAAEQLRLLALLAAEPHEFSEGMLKAIITRPLSSTELDTLVTNSMKTPSAISQAMLVADLFGVDRTGSLPKFVLPTLVIASARSRELEQQRKMAASMPQAQFAVVQDAGHAIFVDQPQRFDSILAAFIANLSKG